MKKLIIFLLLLVVCLKANSQNIIQYEYWYDNNYSGNTVVNTTPEATLNLNTVLAGTAGLTPGLHNVNFRAKDANGKWSVAIMEQFYNTGNWNIDSYEYWFDDNYASKITNAVSPTQTYILASDFDTSAAGYGLHALNFRSKDNAGKWSIVIREYFFKSVGGTQLTNAEYWIDSNFANRQPISFTSGSTVFINQNILTSNLDDQLHTFNFRMQDQAGKWSVVTSSYFMAQSQIVGYEYWFDSNYNLKTEVNIAPTNLLTSQPDFDASDLSEGIHVVHFRAKNSSGKYSVAISQTFTVDFDEAFSITASAGANGSISPIGITNVIAGTNQIYSITPDSCYQIEDVVVDGISQGPITTYSFSNVTTTHTISATFTSISIIYYQDFDGDGFGNPSVTTSACVAPVGYVLNNSDCNDANAAIHPGAVDVCYDGIDNDCNGIIDNACTPIVSTVQGTQCGITLPEINSYIYANLVSGAQGYRFKVTDMTTNQVQTIDKALRVFTLTQLPSYAFNRTYQVEVSIRYNNVWQPFYGLPCTVTTPATTTQVQSAQCSATLINMNDVIFANNVPFAAGYRFLITNLLTSEQHVFDRPIRDIRLTNLPSPQFNTTYSIEVAVKNTNGTYLPYGTACNVTSPSFPTSQVQNSQCDLAATLPLTTTLFADSYTGATTYRFRFVSGTTTIQVDRPIRSIYLASVPGIQAGTAYSVSVALEINGTFGPFGKVCLVTTAGGARETEVVKPVSPFNAMAYPNPFAEHFKLIVTTSVDASIQVKVYDMLGKLVENRTVDTAEINEVEIGENYPAGVYNVIVSQGSEVKTLRVIKR